MNVLNFNPFPLLNTHRMVLRPLTIQDEKEVFALRSDAKVAKNLDRSLAKTIEDAQFFIAKIKKGVDKNHWIYWVMADSISNEFIGTICLWNISKELNQAEIGFETLPKFRKMGYTNEVIQCVLNFAFEQLKFQKIIAEVSSENVASINILEKNNFVFSGKKQTMYMYHIMK